LRIGLSKTVSKPAIDNDQQWGARKSGRNFRQYFNCLLKFGLKQWYLAINPDLLGRNRFLHVIEMKHQR